MSETTRKAAEGVREVIDRLSEDVAHVSGKARKALGESAHKASEFVSEFADEAADRSRKAARYAVREVREHPVTTLAVGAAVGVLVAAILMRKRD
jgi:ElaB/YqjD/DUF883 family membrane-anchored ribosome-binding protein